MKTGFQQGGSMKKLDYSATLHALNEAVASRHPQYVDPTSATGMACKNIDKNSKGEWVPSCIVGTALVWLGVPVDWFVKNDCFTYSATIVTEKLYDDDLFQFTNDALDLLVVAQGHQDEGTNWGEAVARAHLGDLGF